MRDVKDAVRRFGFEITDEDIRNAVPLQKDLCVVACGVRQSVPGCVAIEVGASITLLTMRNSDGTESTIRYKTPTVLKNGLRIFDKTGVWPLGPGIVWLEPPPPCISISTVRKQSTEKRKRRKERGLKSDRDASGKPYEATGSRLPRPLNPRYIRWIRRSQINA